MCVSNHGMLNILRSHISVWNRAMYVSKVSVLKMNEVDMVFYAKFTDLVRLCLDPSFCEAHFVEALSPRDCGDALEECAFGGEQHAAGGYAEGGAEFQF